MHQKCTGEFRRSQPERQSDRAPPDVPGNASRREMSPTSTGIDTFHVYVYHALVIRSFADAVTKDIYDAVNSKAARRIPKAIWPIVRRKLDAVNAAASTEDLALVPGNR